MVSKNQVMTSAQKGFHSSFYSLLYLRHCLIILFQLYLTNILLDVRKIILFSCMIVPDSFSSQLFLWPIFWLYSLIHLCSIGSCTHQLSVVLINHVYPSLMPFQGHNSTDNFQALLRLFKILVPCKSLPNFPRVILYVSYHPPTL